MPKRCAVPNCMTGSRTEQSKHSVFRVPKDAVLWRKWEEAIPGIVRLSQTDVVCDKHFDDQTIAREWIKHDANGQIIARVAYKFPHLHKLAVPTQFDEVPTGKENGAGTGHDYAMRISNGHPITANTNCTNSQRNSLTIANQKCNVSIQSSSLMQPSIRVISTLVGDLLETKNISRVASPSPDNGALLSPTKVANSKPQVADSLTHQKLLKVTTPCKISKKTPEGNASSSAEFAAYVPESWSFVQMRTVNVKWSLFSYTITKLENGVHCPVTQKCVTLDEDRMLNYFIYGRHVAPQDKKLERVLSKKEMLSDILKKFKGMNVCCGLGDVNSHFIPAGEAYQDYVDIWRSKDCSLLSKRKRCDSCMKSRKCVLQRVVRLKNRPTIKRIRDVSNPVDRGLLFAMRLKIRRVRRQKLRAEERVKHLMSCMKAQEAQTATVQDTA